MDERFREELRAQTELAVRESGEQGVRLRGGPMDDWLVKQDAPCFAADWYKTWPQSVADETEPGRYARDETGTQAEWVAVDVPTGE
jgi:hypothetical protein